MNASHRATLKGLRARPFRKFRIELTSGAKLTVEHPEAMAAGAGGFVLMDKTGDFTIFDSTMVAAVRLPKPDAAKKRA